MDGTIVTTVVTATLLIIFGRLIGCVSDMVSPLHVNLIKRTSNQAVIEWSGLDIEDTSSCHISYGIKVDSPQYTIIPVTSTLYMLDGLTANNYSVFVECMDKKNVSHASSEFIIPAENLVTPTADVSQQPKHTHPYSDGSLHPSPYPSVLPEDSGQLSDTLLGVLVGVLGVGIIIFVAYYVGRRYYRNMRIRRLLQYRQQDSDPFGDMDPDSEQ